MDPGLLQNPPPIEERVSRRESEWLGPTVGTPSRGIFKGSNDKTSHVAGDIPEQEDEIKSSSVAVEGRTCGDRNVAAEPQGVKAAEDKIWREKQHTVGFSEYLFKRKTAELISLLNDLKPNLQKVEGAAIMTSFRRALEEIWHVSGPLPKEKILIVSAVEEAVRNVKWRELSVGQVAVLQNVLSNVDGPAVAWISLDRAIRAIQKSRIDIYPSATVDEDDGMEVDDEG